MLEKGHSEMGDLRGALGEDFLPSSCSLALPFIPQPPVKGITQQQPPPGRRCALGSGFLCRYRDRNCPVLSELLHVGQVQRRPR